MAEGVGKIARQLEPALLAEIAARNGEEGGDAGLGGEHVIAGFVGFLRRHVEADGENLPIGIDEESRILFRRRDARLPAQRLANR